MGTPHSGLGYWSVSKTGNGQENPDARLSRLSLMLKGISKSFGDHLFIAFDRLFTIVAN
jgi:hypothetical protein